MVGQVKILHSLETIGSGGVEQTRLCLAKNLDKNVFKQKIACTQSTGVIGNQLKAAGMEVFEVGVFNGIYDPRPYKKLWKIITKYQPDIIHGAVFEGTAMASICGRLKRVPVIITEETSEAVNRSWRGDQLIKRLYKLSDKTIGVSSAVYNYLIGKLRLKEDKVALVNNGVEEKKSWDRQKVEELKTQYGINKVDILLGTVGRLFDDTKKVSVLIKAISRLKGEYPKLKLMVIGDGPDMGKLKELVSSMSLDEQVIFAGYQPDPTPFYQMMDVFALASQREAFGLVNIEAMFRKLPVVATNVGGIPTIVKDGKTGFLVPSNNVYAFSQAIKKLYDDEGLRIEMGNKGYIRARKHFSADSYVQKISDLYQSLLKEKSLI